MLIRPAPKTYHGLSCVEPGQTIARLLEGFQKLGHTITYSPTRNMAGGAGIMPEPILGIHSGWASLDALGPELFGASGRGFTHHEAMADAFTQVAKRYALAVPHRALADHARSHRLAAPDVLETIETLGWLPGHITSTLRKGAHAVPLEEIVGEKLTPTALAALGRQVEAQHWVDAWSVTEAQSVKLPLLLAGEAGLAAADTLPEAIARGAHTLLARHARRTVLGEGRAVATVTASSIDDPEIRSILQRLQAAGVQVIVKDFSLGRGLPCVGVLFGGASLVVRSHPSRRQALLDGLADELAGHVDLQSYADAVAARPAGDARALAFLEKGKKVAWSSLPDSSHDDAQADVDEVTRLCEREGTRLFVVDATHPVLDFPTVVTVIPGLAELRAPSEALSVADKDAAWLATGEGARKLKEEYPQFVVAVQPQRARQTRLVQTVERHIDVSESVVTSPYIWLSTDPRNGLTVVLSYLTGDMLWVNDRVAKALKSGDVSRILPAERQLLISKAILGDPERQRQITFERFGQMHNPDTLIYVIMPFMGCNLACSYCYEEAGRKAKRKMTPAVEDRVVRHIVNAQRDRPMKRITAKFYGGEPLMAWDRCRSIAERLDKGLGHDVDFNIVLQTNGALIRKETFAGGLARLAWAEITLDGPKRLHDQVRVGLDRKPTYERVIEGIKTAAAAGISIHVRVNSESAAEMEESLEDMEAHGLFDIPDLTFYEGRVSSCFTAVFCGLESPDEDAKTHTLVLAMRKFILGSRWRSRWMRYSMRPTAGGLCPHSVRGSYIIDPQGDLYGCIFRPDDPIFKFGTLQDDGTEVFTDSYRQVISRSPLKHERCLKCERLPHCYGGCFARAYFHTGSFANPYCGINDGGKGWEELLASGELGGPVTAKGPPK